MAQAELLRCRWLWWWSPAAAGIARGLSSLTFLNWQKQQCSYKVKANTKMRSKAKQKIHVLSVIVFEGHLSQSEDFRADISGDREHRKGLGTGWGVTAKLLSGKLLGAFICQLQVSVPCSVLWGSREPTEREGSSNQRPSLVLHWESVVPDLITAGNTLLKEMRNAKPPGFIWWFVAFSHGVCIVSLCWRT